MEPVGSLGLWKAGLDGQVWLLGMLAPFLFSLRLLGQVTSTNFC